MSSTGGAPTKLVGHLDDPGPIVVTGGSMVFVDSWETYSDDAQIIQSPLDGSAPSYLASAQNGPLALAISGATASGYFESQGGATFQTPMSGVAAEGADIYWVDQGDPNVEDDGSVMKRPLDPNGASRPTTLATGGMPQGIAVDASNVHWTDSASQTVQRVPLSGGAPTTLATEQVGPLALAIDDTNVYWITIAEGTGEGSIMKMRK